MSARDNGGAAFPTAMREWRGSQDSGAVTLRDYFAAKAMQGLNVAFRHWSHDEISRAAYSQADAMLEARK